MKKKKKDGFLEGDILFIESEDGYNLCKVLAVEDESEWYHMLSYCPLKNRPSVQDIDKLAVFIFHSPFDKQAFQHATWLANRPLTARDLMGYHAFLRQTKDANDYIPIAMAYFNAGLQLTDEKKHDEAIDAYSKAADLIPQFFEAIDNRAFCKMDMGLWQEAIDDFTLSLELNPGSVLAEFSIGECYYNMGDFQKAKQQFEIAIQMEPDNQLALQFLEKVK